jgi:hypothetical protein
MSGMTATTLAMRTLDAKALSELALALCLGGAIVVWIGVRFDRQVFRWAGITVIVLGLGGLIFQNSLSRQTLAQPGFTLPSASPTPSVSPSPSPSPSPAHKPKPKKKPTHKPAPPPPSGGSGSSGGTVPPPHNPPSQQPLPPIDGSPVPPGG